MRAQRVGAVPGDGHHLAAAVAAEVVAELAQRGLHAVLGEHQQHVAGPGRGQAGGHVRGVEVVHGEDAQQRQPQRQRARVDVVLAQADDEHRAGLADQAGDRGQGAGRVDQAGGFLGLGLAQPQAVALRRARLRVLGAALAAAAVAVGAHHRLADRRLQVRVAAEAELLAELDHARLADPQRVGQLLRGIVAQQLRVLDDEVGDAALDRRHPVAFGAELDQRRHRAPQAARSFAGARPSMLRMPSPGASVTLISDSLNTTPLCTGSKRHSYGPSRSTLLITSDFATARCTAAATPMLDSSMQPIMQSMPYRLQMSAMRTALEMPPVFISLMLTMSAARMRISSTTSRGPNTLSSAITGVCTRSVT